MKVDNQKDVRTNLYAIARRIEYKARMHLLDIEPFDISVSPYLMLEGKVENDTTQYQKASGKSYAVLGVPEYASNDEIAKKYKHLMKSYHPDMALSDEAKKEFQNKSAEINIAYAEVRKERGL